MNFLLKNSRAFLCLNISKLNALIKIRNIVKCKNFKNFESFEKFDDAFE